MKAKVYILHQIGLGEERVTSFTTLNAAKAWAGCDHDEEVYEHYFIHEVTAIHADKESEKELSKIEKGKPSLWS